MYRHELRLAALLVATVPLWMVLTDRVVNGRPIPSASWLALVVGVAGVGILARPNGHGSVVPVLIVLGGSLCWGSGSVLAGRLPSPARPLLGSAMEMLTGGAVLGAVAAMTGELSRLDPGRMSGRSVLALLYLIGPCVRKSGHRRCAWRPAARRAPHPDHRARRRRRPGLGAAAPAPIGCGASPGRYAGRAIMLWWRTIRPN